MNGSQGSFHGDSGKISYIGMPARQDNAAVDLKTALRHCLRGRQRRKHGN